MSSISDLPARWRDLLSTGTPAQQEVDSSHPLRLLFGTDDSRRPLFAVMARIKPAEPDLPSDVLDTVITKRSDGFYVLVISLRDQTLFDVFAQLCTDLAARSRASDGEVRALHEVYTALGEWKRLLRTRQEHLSLESLRGLTAELWYGWARLTAERPLDQVFTRWTGPFGAHQDFQFADGQLVEVKAVRPEVDWIQIASEHQLASSDNYLRLAVVELEDSEPGTEGALSLPGLLSAIRQELALAPLAAAAFETAVREFRDPFTHTFYDQNCFTVRGCHVHDVSEGFPRLVPRDLPRGVSGVVYRVAREAIADFVRTTD